MPYKTLFPFIFPFFLFNKKDLFLTDQQNLLASLSMKITVYKTSSLNWSKQKKKKDLMSLSRFTQQAQHSQANRNKDPPLLNLNRSLFVWLVTENKIQFHFVTDLLNRNRNYLLVNFKIGSMEWERASGTYIEEGGTMITNKDPYRPTN